jgi:hypothetical protein
MIEENIDDIILGNRMALCSRIIDKYQIQLRKVLDSPSKDITVQDIEDIFKLDYLLIEQCGIHDGRKEKDYFK